MGFNIIQVVQGLVAPEIQAIKVQVSSLEQAEGELKSGDAKLHEKIEALDRRISGLEGLIKGLEPALKIQLENLILRNQVLSKKRRFFLMPL